MIIANGSTDVTTYFVLRDSTNHAPKTDVTITDIDLYYVEERAAISAKADATALAAADSAHGDNQAYHVGQGLYRIDWPDAAFDGGVGKKVTLIVVCTGVDTTFLEIELSPAADVRAYGGTAGTFSSGRPEVNATHWGGTAVASATVSANVTQISGDSTAADNLEAAHDGTGYNVGGGAIVAASVTGNVGGNVAGSVASVTAMVSANVTQFGGAGGDFSGGIPSVNIKQISGDSIAADNAESFFDGTGYAGTNNVIPSVTTVGSVTGAVGSVTGNIGGRVVGSVGGVEADGISADAVSAAAVTKIQAGLATSSVLSAVGSYVDTEVAAIKAVTDKLDTAVELDGSVYRFTTNALEQAPTGSGASAATIAAAVWDEALSGHSTAGTSGKALTDVLDDTGTSGVVLTSAAANAAADAFLDRSSAIDGKTPREVYRGVASLMLAKATGLGTGTESYKKVGDDATERIGTSHSGGTRTVTLNLT